jgi:hypothetical protein
VRKKLLATRTQLIGYLLNRSVTVVQTYPVLNWKPEQISRVRFDVLTTVKMSVLKMAVFWVIAPSSLVEVYQHFRGPCCLHHHPGDGGSKDL